MSQAPGPAAPNSIFFDAGALKLRVLRWQGDPSRGTFVLLHGLASNARFWELVAPRLAAAGHPVLAPDLRGHGLSDKPADGYDFPGLAEDVRRLVQGLAGAPALVAGHSWGGMVALEYAARHSPAGVALVDGGFTQASDFPEATWEKTERALTPPRLAGTPLQEFLSRLDAAKPVWILDEHRRQIVLANFDLRLDGTIAPHLAFETHMRIVRHIWDYPTYAVFDRVPCPVLMVAARPVAFRRAQDEVFVDLKTRGEAEATRRLKDSSFVWMEETDHDIPLHRPKELADLLLDFGRRAFS